jgi:hypothetical protein
VIILLYGKFQKSSVFKKKILVSSSFQYTGTNLARDNFLSVCRSNNTVTPSLPRSAPSHFHLHPVQNQSVNVKCIWFDGGDGGGKHFLYQCETVTNKWVLICVTDNVNVPNSASPQIETCGKVFSTLSTSLTPDAVKFRVLIHTLQERIHQEGRDWRDIQQAAYQ